MNGPYFPVYLELFHGRILNLHFKHPLLSDTILNDLTPWYLQENVLVNFDVAWPKQVETIN